MRAAVAFLVCLPLATLTAPALMALQIDVYVVYGRGDRPVKDELLGALPEGLSVRSYNSNFLALADYSGKQKVMSKLQTARVVVVLSDSPLDYLEGRLSNTDLVIVSSVSTALTSDRRTVHVVPSGTNVTALGADLNAIDVGREADLADRAEVQAAEVILVDESPLGLARSVSLVVQRMLGA